MIMKFFIDEIIMLDGRRVDWISIPLKMEWKNGWSQDGSFLDETGVIETGWKQVDDE